MALLVNIGSTAPFVGLFGTVWAIYTTLVKIGESGQASVDRVASISLIPLVDVTLLLPIIFLVPFGVLGDSVPVNCAGKTAQARDINGNYVVISVDKAGNLYLNDMFAPDVQAFSSLM